jgi:hypothetical protein
MRSRSSWQGQHRPCRCLAIVANHGEIQHTMQVCSEIWRCIPLIQYCDSRIYRYKHVSPHTEVPPEATHSTNFAPSTLTLGISTNTLNAPLSHQHHDLTNVSVFNPLNNSTMFRMSRGSSALVLFAVWSLPTLYLYVLYR